MKKLLSLIISLAMVFSLAACSNNRATTDETNSESEDLEAVEQNGEEMPNDVGEPPVDEDGNQLPPPDGEGQEITHTYTDVTINGIEFTVMEEMYTWDELPDSDNLVLGEVESYTNDEGVTHWYQRVSLIDNNLDWYQMAYLADDAGGYLACLSDEGENEFVFSLVDDEEYWYIFEADGDHYGIMMGPALGGWQPDGEEEPDGGWQWLSGEEWNYENWAVNLDDGVIDQDPRDNTQPNDSHDDNFSGQQVMGYGEMNEPVSTWGDYMACMYKPNGSYEGLFAFVIEYETEPTSHLAA